MEINVNQTLFELVALLNQSSSTQVNQYNVCISTPPHILSDGVLGGHKTQKEPSKSAFPVFLLQIIVIYTITRTLQFPVKKLGLPAIISQLMAGLIIGPMLPIFENYKMMLFPNGSQDTLATITAFGYILLLFETGVKMDIQMIMGIGKKGWAIAIVGCIAPLLIAIGMTTSKDKINMFEIDGGGFDPRLILVLHNTTSFAVISSVLNDLQLLNSELGRLALSSSLLSDILGNIVVVFKLIIAPENYNPLGVGIKLGSIVLVLIFFFLFYRPAMFWVIERTPEGKEVKDIYMSIILGFLFSLCWFSGHLGIGPIFIPFLFGLATPEGAPLGATLVKRIHLLGTKFLLPIYVTTAALKVQPSFLDSGGNSLKIAAQVVVMGYLFKVGACFISSLLFTMPFNDALSLSLILNSKGVVEVVTYSAAMDRNDIKVIPYAVVFMLMIFSICISHILIKHLYDPSRKYAGYQERNIISLKPNSNLKILVCIHRQHHITPITTLLDIFYPTNKDPITVDALHLIELVGRSSPIFISHKKRDAVSLNLHDSYSDSMVLSFKLYEDEKQGAAVVNPYTAISPLNFMYEDVCNLALDRASSIIILPFHLRWSSDGKVEFDDKNIMSLNCMVLDRSPCSVGILVTRVVPQVDSSSSSSIRLAIIFLGGKDDREALCLGNRAARNAATIDLVIYHIVCKNRIEEDVNNMDAMLDKAMLKYAIGFGNVTYREIEVEGGSQTVNVLRQIVNIHDFIIVGRRNGINSPQTNGLQGWSEFPELGLIGDYLASSDLGCKASLLVVQQQQKLSR